MTSTAEQGSSFSKQRACLHLIFFLGWFIPGWNQVGTLSGFAAPPFAKQAIGLPQLYQGSVAWGDADNDGKLDILLAGWDGTNFIAQLWRNHGNGFTNFNAGLPGVSGGSGIDSRGPSVDWGDYDNDGRLDILQIGGTNAYIWRNTGSAFININANLPFSSYPAHWGDYDNDGRLDVLTCSNVFQNTVRGFTNVTTGMWTFYTAGAWGDYDNDGKLDFFGSAFYYAPHADVWHNSDNAFQLSFDLDGGDAGAHAWGDFDNDGQLDLLLTAHQYWGGPGIAQVWKNTGAGFTNINAGLTGVSGGSVAWGDYDNDGRLDILLTGKTGVLSTPNNASNYFTQVWRNTGLGFFNINAGLPGLFSSSVAWGDYDNDGRLDIILTGNDGTNSITQIWRNLTAQTNHPPTAPTELMADPNAFGVNLRWNPSTDTETPSPGLTYNLRIGTTPGGCDIFSPQSSDTGFRRVPKMGNMQARLSEAITNLSPGTYYWSVQAVDSAFAGSQFAPESTFEIAHVWMLPTSQLRIITNVSPTNALLEASVNPYGESTAAFFEYGTTTNYGSKSAITNLGNGVCDLLFKLTLTGLEPSTEYHFRLVSWNTVGTNYGTDFTFTTAIFEDTQIGLADVRKGSVAWGDYDNDGRLDLLMAGCGNYSCTSVQLYRNTEAGFSNVPTALTPVMNASVAWGDYDNDGKLDILLAGQTYSCTAITEVWRNTGAGFSNINAGLTGVGPGKALWYDLDRDGQLEVLLSGTGNGYTISEVWHYASNGYVRTNLAIPEELINPVTWVDYDNDGRIDYYLYSQLWHNIGIAFTNVNPGWPLLGNDAAAWADFDRDGKLEVVVTGQDNDGYSVSKLYRNCAVQTNVPPAAPGTLAAEVTDLGVRLSWNPGSDTETPASNLTYNLRIGTGPGLGDIVSPESFSDGLRLVPQPGNAGPGVTTYITNLSLGTFYWTVQTIDSVYAGSPFAEEASFEIVPFAPRVVGFNPERVGATNAIFQFAVNPDGAPTRVYLEYGTTTNYGSATEPADIGNGIMTFSGILASGGILAGTEYHCRVVAWNSLGTNLGPGLVFRTAVFADIESGFPGVLYGAVAWGDYDADGRLDVILTGSTGTNIVAQVWRNTGYGFSNINAGLTGVWRGSVAWGDYDNDGRLDILIAGRTNITSSGWCAQIWRNTGYGFTNINAGLPDTYILSAIWGDYDNDGKLDILLNGTGGCQVWRNTGTGFINTLQPITGTYTVQGSWGDYDNDGRLDILASGGGISQVLRNAVSGFTNINAGLPGLGSAVSAIWGDYDGDGRLDILLAGYPNGGTYLTELWRNTRNGFLKVDAGLPQLGRNSVAWGDYDNDGHLELILAGMSWESGEISKIWRNLGDSFSDCDAGLPYVLYPSVAWGDCDNDGKLDLFLAGLSTSGYIAQVWRNYNASTNNRPTAPTELGVKTIGLGVNLHWEAGFDLETPASSLSYNLRVGTTPGGIDIVSPHSSTNGQRFIPQMGNMQERHFALLTNLHPGVYYWSVQSIDSSFAGSLFAPEQNFFIGPVILGCSNENNGSLQLQGEGIPGTNYFIQTSIDLINWTNLISIATGADGCWGYTNTDGAIGSRRFFRLLEP